MERLVIDALAHRIVARCLGPGQVVALGARDSGMYLISALALARLGNTTLMHCRTSGATGAARVTPIGHALALRRLSLRALTLARIAGHRGRHLVQSDICVQARLRR